jgi:hypothetical protein
MSMPQVGQGAVAVVPTFKGFRSSVNKETDAAANESTKGFRSAWSKEGTTSGKATGTGFKKAFQGESAGFSDKATRELEANVAKVSRALSQARLKQLDQVGKVRVAEAQLVEAQAKHATGSSQVTRAMERLASETRKLETANESTTSATNDLKDAQNKLATAADRAGDQLNDAGRSGARKFSSGFSEVFKGSFLGTTVAGLASSLVSNIGDAIGTGLRTAVDLVVGSVDIASDLNESINAVGVAYGEAADAVLALGENSAQTFGLSKRELNGYATQFSSFVRTISGEGGDVAHTLLELVGRGSDFASVFNLEVADALGLFQSGLAGESEPLRRYGIDLSAATVETYAYANGIAAAGEELTEAQKVQARYGALLQQTAAVSDDFANTSDQLANKNRINAATWDDLQAKIGAGLLPIVTQLATVVADDLLPVIEQLVEEQGPGLTAAFEQAIPALREMAEEVLPQLPGLFQSMADTLPAVIELTTQLAPVVIWLSQAVGGWVTALSGLFSLLAGDVTLEEFTAQMEAIPGPIGDVFRAAAELGAGLGSALGIALREVNNFGRDVQLGIDRVVGWFRDLPGRVGSFFAGAGDWLYSSGRSIIQGFINGITSMLKPVGDAVSGVLSWAQGFFPRSPAKRGPFSGSGWTQLEKSGAAVMEQWQSGMARPDLTGALSPAYAATSVGLAAPVASSSAQSGPAVFHLYDVDGVLIGTIQGEIAGASSARKTRLEMGSRR